MATEPTKIAYGGDMMLFLASLPIAFSTSAKLEIKLATRDIGSKDSGNWKEKLPGKLEFSASTDALYTEVLTATTTTTTHDELYALMIARTPIVMAFGATTGDAPAQTLLATKKNFTGSVYITAISVNAPDNETVSYSVSFEGTGSLVMA